MAGLVDTLAHLVAAFSRTSIALPVRQSAVNVPPWNAIPISYAFTTDIFGATAVQRWGVHWTAFADSTLANAPANAHIVRADSFGDGIADGKLEMFPRGYVGVVWAEMQAQQVVTGGAAELPKQARWTWEKNGAPVPGYQNTIPGGSNGAMLVGAPIGFNYTGTRTMAPVVMRGGDTMSATIDATQVAGVVQCQFSFRALGWMWPATFPDPTTIRGVDAQ